MLNSLCICLLLISITATNCSEQECARSFLKYVSKLLEPLYDEMTEADWNFYSNITSANKRKCVDTRRAIFKIETEMTEKLKKYNWRTFEDKNLGRQFEWFFQSYSIDPIKNFYLNSILEEIVYRKVPSFQNDSVYLTPEMVSEKLASIGNPAELKHIWLQSQGRGHTIRDYYGKIVERSLLNVKLKGYDSAMNMTLEILGGDFKSTTFADTYSHFRHCYIQLHAFVRHRLKAKYGSYISATGPIPAHLMGQTNSASYQWMTNILIDTKQYQIFNYLFTLKFSRKDLFKASEEFFISLGFPPISNETWTNSKFEEEVGVYRSSLPISVVCKRNIYWIDIFDYETVSNIYDILYLTTTYYANECYRKLDILFYMHPLTIQAHSVQHFIQLSMLSASYLEQMTNSTFSVEEYQPLLLYNGLKFIPYVINYAASAHFRRLANKGDIAPENYTVKYWDLLYTEQGIITPVPINKAGDNIDFSTSVAFGIVDFYINQFVSFIMGHQLYYHLCLKYGQYEPGNPSKPLHNCNLYGNKEVGELLQEGFEQGPKKHFTYMLEKLNISYDVKGFWEYYNPLLEWLTAENQKLNATIGWGVDSQLF